MSVNADVKELIDFLECNNLDVVRQIKNIVSEKLYVSRDHSLLGTLIDRYMQTKSERLVDLFICVNDTDAMYLFEKLNDHLKHGSTNEVCNILFSIVKKQPSWLHKIVATTLFANFLKALKGDQDIVLLMGGIFVLCVLIPCVPAILGASNVKEIFDVFYNCCGVLLNRSNSVAEVCILHLNVGVYIFFHRLYAMFPNNFLSYLQSLYNGEKNSRKELIFQQIIKPMFEFVKFQPDLVTETKKSELGRDRWRFSQPHDVLAECQKISLDPVDAIKEAGYATFNEQTDGHTSRCSMGETSSAFIGLNSCFSDPDHSSNFNTPKKENLDNTKRSKLFHSKALLKNIHLNNELSERCGFTTPPSSRPISPSVSAQDMTSLHSMNKHDSCIQGSTHTLSELQGERKSSGESLSSIGPKNPLKKTHSFNSIDNQKNIFRNWLSNTATHSTPTSPRKSGDNKKSVKRPPSADLYKRDLVKQFAPGVQSAPNSPMVSVAPFQFAFSDKEQKVGSNEHLHIRSNSPAAEVSNAQHITPNTQHTTPTSLHTAIVTSEPTPNTHYNTPKMRICIKEMFSELVQKQLADHDSGIESSTISRKTRTPLNLLDDFIQNGADIHSYQLSRIPLASHLETDWTHFGGTTPVDELKILQTQIHLLHTQLLYERYKCDLHCLRNRRLFGNLRKLQGDTHEIEDLKSQLSLSSSEGKKYLQTAQILCEEKRKIEHQAKRKEEELQTLLKESERKNAELAYKLKVAKSKKKEEKRKFNLVQNELLKTKHQLFDATQELLHVQPKLEEVDKLKETVEVLRKELVIQAEKQQRVKQQVNEFCFKNTSGSEEERQLEACKKEMQVYQEERELYKSLTESLKLKLKEAELALKNQETNMKDGTKSTDNLRAKHKREIKALESRFESCRKTCQSLQSYLSSVYAKLEESHSTRVHSSHSTSPGHLSGIAWTSHSCGDKCKRSTSFTHLDSINHPHNHDHSHRHHLSHTLSQGHNDNPFSKTRNLISVSSENETLQKSPDEILSEDNGIEVSSDIINHERNNGILNPELNKEAISRDSTDVKISGERSNGSTRREHICDAMYLERSSDVINGKNKDS